MAYQYQTYSVVPAAAPAQAYAPAPTYDPNAFASAAAPTVTYAPAQYVTAAPPPAQYATQYVPGNAAPAAHGNRDEIRTIFVTGFPPDIRDRELTNMCRFMQGYEAASMKGGGHGGPQGFVLFQYGQAAQSAVAAMNGLDFGEGYRLRAEMARKNMYVTRTGEGAVDHRPAKSYRTDGGGAGPGASGSSWGDRERPDRADRPDRNSDNPPCDTLFIGNVTMNVSDEQIAAYFRRVQPERFKACKVNRNNNRVSAFVQFVDAATAQQVLVSEQGKEMPGSERGPMRIQFSRNALGAGSKRYRDDDSAYMPRQTPTPNSDISPGDGSAAVYRQPRGGDGGAPQPQPQAMQQAAQIMPSAHVMAPVAVKGEYAPPPDALQFQTQPPFQGAMPQQQ